MTVSHISLTTVEPFKTVAENIHAVMLASICSLTKAYSLWIDRKTHGMTHTNTHTHTHTHSYTHRHTHIRCTDIRERRKTSQRNACAHIINVRSLMIQSASHDWLIFGKFQRRFVLNAILFIYSVLFVNFITQSGAIWRKCFATFPTLHILCCSSRFWTASIFQFFDKVPLSILFLVI